MEGEWISLGIGVVDWDKNEEASQRYGAIKLLVRPHGGPTISFYHSYYQGRKARLIAKVFDTRDYPGSSAAVNENVVLGEGALFFQKKKNGNEYVGLKPQGGQKKNWLDVSQLESVHMQSVELYFQLID